MNNLEIMFSSEFRKQKKSSEHKSERDRLLEFARARSELVMPFRVKK